MKEITITWLKRTAAFALTAVMLVTASCHSQDMGIGEPPSVVFQRMTSSAPEPQKLATSSKTSSLPLESSSSEEVSEPEQSSSESEAISSAPEEVITKMPPKQVAQDVKEHEKEQDVKPEKPAPPPVINQPEEEEENEGDTARYLVYLSPSKQFSNSYVNGGNEGQYMNLIAEEMIPYLKASGVGYILADTNTNLYHRAEQSDAAGCDLYLSLHSNAANGKRRGTIAFYKKGSSEGARFADIVTSNFRQISPTPNEIVTQYDPWEPGENGFIETREPKAPSVLIEVAYHDNVADANWIKGNIKTIAANLAKSITDTLGVPFRRPGENVPVQSLTLDATEASLELGTSYQLHARVSPADIPDPALTWTTGDSGVATVKNGNVTSVGIGTAVITAATPDGKSASCTITVYPSVTEIRLNYSELQMFPYEEIKLKVTALPQGSGILPFLWSSSDSSVVSVNKGVIQAQKPGTAVITVKTSTGVTASCKVTVKEDDYICNRD